ncbi:unnamed protein product [Dracunculus medinensis]|uniref:DNA helicase n=1 Tax=Dracunculus medinensis TaxID=318479 RepID=A0A0N4UP88_DRAME|nr:unnamed protein product [Dracunculus medinensis]
MSNKKQASLFTFFSKTPKVQKQASENSAITTSECKNNIFVNSSNKKLPNDDQQEAECPDDNFRTKKRHIIEDSNFSKIKRKSKRARAILSSDSESDIEKTEIETDIFPEKEINTFVENLSTNRDVGCLM